MVTLDKDKYFDKWDSDWSFNFSKEEKKQIIEFLMNHPELFDEEVNQIGTPCDKCDTEKTEVLYICHIYSIDEENETEKYRIFAEAFSFFPEYRSFDENYDSLCLVYCKDCGSWRIFC